MNASGKVITVTKSLQQKTQEATQNIVIQEQSPTDKTPTPIEKAPKQTKNTAAHTIS